MLFHTVFSPPYRYYTSFCVYAIALLSLLLSIGIEAQALSPSEAADRARHSTGGKVLKVKSPQGDNTDYRIKVLLPQGKVRNVMVDGNSGKIRPSPPRKKEK